MAVFTPVTHEQLQHFLQAYDLGELREFEGIASGIENSNFFVTTGAGRFVLTLFERLTAAQLPFYLDLMHHLAGAGIPCPDPVADKRSRMLAELAGKPAALVTCLPGREQMRPGVEHCQQVGATLARMHLAAASFGGKQPNLRGLSWWLEAAGRVAGHLPAHARALLDDEMAVQRTFASSAAAARLPRSAVHADLFRDNVLFVESSEGLRLGGIIDFYFAGVDTWIYDLAVTVNDWCTRELRGDFDIVRLDALMGSYQAHRPLQRDEQLAWPYALRAAALRFWLSRLDDALSPRPAQMITPKDPSHFERILVARRQDAVTVGTHSFYRS